MANIGLDCVMSSSTTKSALLFRGATLKSLENFGLNVLHNTIRSNRWYSTEYKQSLAEALEKTPNLTHQADVNGETLLHYAAVCIVEAADISLAIFLLSTRADHVVHLANVLNQRCSKDRFSRC